LKCFTAFTNSVKLVHFLWTVLLLNSLAVKFTKTGFIALVLQKDLAFPPLPQLSLGERHLGSYLWSCNECPQRFSRAPCEAHVSYTLTVTHRHHGPEASAAGFALSGRGTAAGDEPWARHRRVRYGLSSGVKPLFISHFRQLIA